MEVFKGESKVEKTGQNSPVRSISLLGSTSRVGDGPPDTIVLDGFSSTHTLLNKIRSTAPDELKRQLEALANSPRPSQRVMELIVAHLAALDPEGTFNFLRTSESLYGGHFDIVLAEWAMRDLSAALDASFTIDSRGVILADFVSKLPGEKCEEIYQALLERGFDKESPAFFANVVSYLVQNDPQLAAERALGLVDGAHAIGNVMSHWYMKDPDGAIHWVESLEDPNARKNALETLAGVSLGAGMEGFDRVWELLDEGQRNTLSRNINRQGHDLDIDAVLDWADKKVESPLQHQRILSSLMKSLPHSSEPERLEQILSHWEGDLELDVVAGPVMQISQKWAEKDMESFETWMKSIEDPAIRTAAEGGLLEYWMNEDPDKAIAYWELHHYGSDMNVNEVDQTGRSIREGMSNLVNRMIEETDQIDLHTLTERLPEAWHDVALDAYVSKFSKEAPAETLRVLETLPEGESRNRGLQLSLGYWTTQDPTEAAEWVSGLAESEQREFAARNLANTWARTDPHAAMAWLESQPPSVSRDKAAEQIVRVASDFYPEMALPLLQGIGDQEMRERLLEETVSDLARRDPDAAAQYVESADLGDRWSDTIERERALRDSFQDASAP